MKVAHAPLIKKKGIKWKGRLKERRGREENKEGKGQGGERKEGD